VINQADNPGPPVQKELELQIMLPHNKIRCVARDCQTFFFLKTDLAIKSRTHSTKTNSRKTWKSNQIHDIQIEPTSAGENPNLQIRQQHTPGNKKGVLSPLDPIYYYKNMKTSGDS
jgi:hypothetical protein